MPLSEKQYHEICNACDRVLMASDSTMERVAIPWLHVIREHPVFLENYAELFGLSTTKQGFCRRLSGKARTLAVYARQVARAFREKGRLWYCNKQLPNKVDFLFVSHLLNASQAAQPHDFYFGDAPDQLTDQGFSTAIVLINHTGKHGSTFGDQWKESAVPRIILSDSMPFYEEHELCRRLKRESNRLQMEATSQTCDLDRAVCLRAAQEALLSGSVGTLRMASQISNLISETHSSTLVLTHEGHAWERIVFASVRRVNPNIRCVGYQHAAVFLRQHAIRRGLAPEYNPSHIVTAGSVGKRQLEGSPGLSGISISILGSNRNVPSIPNDVRSNSSDIHGEKNQSTCLVLPEGLPSECHCLFNFSLDCAIAFPKIQFIWRLHPLIEFKSLVLQNPKLKNLPPNICFSNDPLAGDFARSEFVLYRGSTAAVQAVAAGLRPIYLRLSEDEMTIDPMYEIQDCIHQVASKIDFGVAMDRATGFKNKSNEASRSAAQRYCEDFFGELAPSVLSKIGSHP